MVKGELYLDIQVMKSVKVTNNHIRQNKKGYGAAGSIYVGLAALYIYGRIKLM